MQIRCLITTMTQFWNSLQDCELFREVSQDAFHDLLRPISMKEKHIRTCQVINAILFTMSMMPALKMYTNLHACNSIVIACEIIKHYKI